MTTQQPGCSRSTGSDSGWKLTVMLICLLLYDGCACSPPVRCERPGGITRLGVLGAGVLAGEPLPVLVAVTAVNHRVPPAGARDGLRARPVAGEDAGDVAEGDVVLAGETAGSGGVHAAHRLAAHRPYLPIPSARARHPIPQLAAGHGMPAIVNRSCAWWNVQPVPVWSMLTRPWSWSSSMSPHWWHPGQRNCHTIASSRRTERSRAGSRPGSGIRPGSVPVPRQRVQLSCSGTSRGLTARLRLP